MSDSSFKPAERLIVVAAEGFFYEGGAGTSATSPRCHLWAVFCATCQLHNRTKL